jgi:adenosylcobinamide hydrolase
VGSATRACVREAVRASLAARYGDASPPATVDDADHGTTTTDVATVFEPGSL